MSCHAPVSLRRLTSIRDVDADTWNGLVRAAGHGGYPFIQHEYLRALEDSGSVGAGTGWAPEHIILEDDSGLVAAAPAYRKAHSYGEFVFDFAWAQAYRQCGLDYYPKLVCAIPFAPVEGPRLLARHEAGRAELAAALNDHIQPGPQEASSLHLLFADHADIRALETAGGLLRRDCQFQWFNRDYADFDTFLATLPARRRKEIRRERRKLHDAGVVVEHWHPRDIDEDLWDWLYAAYARNYRIRGQLPYLTPAFFRQLAVAMPDQVHYAIARLGNQPLGMAFMMRGGDTLYGRHWGCVEDIDGLHFETCYYHGIDTCIRDGLARFDAGAQGEHKIRRGFEPVATYSAHLIREPRLRQAIADFLQRERRMMSDYQDEQRRRCAFPDAGQPVA